MNEMRKLFYSYKNLIISGMLILLAIVGVIFIIWPATKRALEIRTDIGVLREKNKALNNKIAILDGVDEEMYTTLYAELLRAVPTDQSLTTLFSTIDGLGVASGVTVGNLTLSRGGSVASDSAAKQTSEEVKVGSTVLTFTVTITGTYEQLRDFFFRVTQVRRILRVRSFDFSLSDPANISVQLLMDAFYSPYRTTLGSADTPIEPLTETDSQMISQVSSMPLVVGVKAINPQNPATPLIENKENIFEP